jgi:hypothetical protein
MRWRLAAVVVMDIVVVAAISLWGWLIYSATHANPPRELGYQVTITLIGATFTILFIVFSVKNTYTEWKRVYP